MQFPRSKEFRKSEAVKSAFSHLEGIVNYRIFRELFESVTQETNLMDLLIYLFLVVSVSG